MGLTYGVQQFITSLRRLNTLLDRAYYPISGLTAKEQDDLSADSCAEGGIVVVQPLANPQQLPQKSGVTLYPSTYHPASGRTTHSYPISSKPQDASLAVECVVVAGVGSSALGTAALARQVANYLQRNVAGVVSGCGLLDATSEAIGGWFFLRTANLLSVNGRVDYQSLFNLPIMAGIARHFTPPMIKEYVKQLSDEDEFTIMGASDREVLHWLMGNEKNITLLVGHSKGNFIIEEYHQSCSNRAKNLRVITMGAPIAYPPQRPIHYQAIGSWDSFGWLNNTAVLNINACRAFMQQKRWFNDQDKAHFQEIHPVPMAMHRVKCQEPFSLNVAEILHDAGVNPGIPPAANSDQS